ncbi:hypothetical protein [Aeoliella sp.]|uniref:hypothetical protein n=1 Tax=Aeoliella sp. TaxID=2795800 RepID=UPI003CCBC1A1
MAYREPNPYEASIDNAEASSPTPGKNNRLAILILLFELPVVLLLVHGVAYLFHAPGSAVVVNEYGGMQPLAFTFFRILSTGGLFLILAFGCWQAAKARVNAWRFGLYVGISYAIASVAWWAMIGLGAMMRFT